ncbi:MAG: amidohydrolase family protein [Kiritimatiellae bacterium]|nr:amidohydrolase family protein [Kiritimatiellia bacterium]
MLDIKIFGGRVFDGCGSDPLWADIGIQRDRIVEVGDFSKAEAITEIDANGKYVCPGFIDVHSHSDAYLLIEPSAPSKIYQGVTTEVVGNCGASAAPCVGEYKLPSDWREQTYPGTWSTVAEYRELLDQARPAPNVYLLIGHNSLRAGVMGYEAREATPDDVRNMQRLLDQSLEEGGRGFSTGLIYTPGIFSSKEEVLTLSQIVAERKGIYTSHMRSESDYLLEAIDETINVGQQTGIRVQISHLKTSGQRNWHLIDNALEQIRSARESGLEVAADRYPYTAACTDLDVIFPDWALEGGRETELARLRDPRTRSKIRDVLFTSRDQDYWETVTIGSTHHPDNATFQGSTLLQVAKHLNLDPVDTVLHLVETDELLTGGIFFGMSEENMWRILEEPYVMIGSDGSIRSPEGPLSHDHPHPRAYGSFPKYLGAVLGGKTVKLSEAIRKMTSLPAEHFQIHDRGILAAGMMADIIVFNPEEINDVSSYIEPHQLSKGIDRVIVNGVLTLDEGSLTGRRGGYFLE